MRDDRRILLEHVRRVALAADAARATDGEMLRAFARGGPAACVAFEAILHRHGPMVYRVCRAALPSVDADDAFQATFLVLVRRRHSLALRGALGPWLFGVARRVCTRARRAAAARPSLRPPDDLAVVADDAPLAADVAEVVGLVHREVDRLPAALRSVVVLCDLEGLTYEAAAERLGLGHATVRGRLARARERLRRRLARWGYGPPGALAVLPVPRALARATAAAAEVAAGRAAGSVPESVLSLVNGGIQAMVLSKLKPLGLSALTAGVLIAGAVGLSGQTPKPPAADADAPLLADFVRAPIGEVDFAALIADLARDAQKLKETNPAAAADTAKQIEALARAWRERLQKEATLRAARNAEDAKRDLQSLTEIMLKEVKGANPGADLEKRVRSLEEKLDRILKTLELSDRKGPEKPATENRRR